MMGIKEREFKVRTQLCLDELVPENHFYRRLEVKLELKFVRELVRHFYVPYGRASIDPVVFFKLPLIMLFEGIIVSLVIILKRKCIMEEINNVIH